MMRSCGFLTAFSLAATVALTSASAQTLPNYVRCSIATGGMPIVIGAGDFNRDGNQDFAVLDSANSQVLIFFGDSSKFARGDCDGATSRTAVSLGSNVAATGLAVGDIFGNATSDIAVTEAQGVVVLSNDGEGNFTAQTPEAAGADPRAVAIADIDGDGSPDMAVADGAGNSLQLLFGRATGGFDPRVTVAIGQAVIGVAIADLNVDGRLDLVALSSQNTVTVALQSTTVARQFATKSPFVVGTAPQAMAVADFNRDGIPDIAVANRGGGEFALFTGALSATYQESDRIGTDLGLAALVAGNLNRDGHLDAVVAGDLGTGEGRAQPFLGNASGGFDQPPALALGQGPTSLALTDVDGDGLPDILSADTLDAAVSVLLSSNPPATPTFTPTNTPLPTGTNTPTSTATSTPTETPTATPSATPTSTFSPSPTRTPTLAPVTETPTAGVFGVQGTCAVDPTGRSGWSGLIVLLLPLYLGVRRLKPKA